MVPALATGIQLDCMFHLLYHVIFCQQNSNTLRDITYFLTKLSSHFHIMNYCILLQPWYQLLLQKDAKKISFFFFYLFFYPCQHLRVFYCSGLFLLFFIQSVPFRKFIAAHFKMNSKTVFLFYMYDVYLHIVN